jgi:uncharacterized integral membrane protein
MTAGFKNNESLLEENLNTLKVGAISAIALLSLIVVLQNTQAVETKLLFLTLTLPNAALLFGTLIVGFVIGVVITGHIVSSAKRTPPVPTTQSSRAIGTRRTHPSSYPTNVDVRSNAQRAEAAGQAES